MINLKLIGNDFDYEMKMLIKLFYPLEEISMEQNSDLQIEAIMSDTMYRCNIIKGCQVVSTYNHDVNKTTDRKKAKRLLKFTVYKALSQYLGKRMPWGILTGIRPTKIILDLMDRGRSIEDITAILTNEYCISTEKIDLMLEVATTEMGVIKLNKKDEYSLYIGIPFCPTKCLYCSFTSYSLEKFSKHLDAYVGALIKEIDAVHNIMKGKPLRSIYIGGGTPTSLSATQLDRLLKHLTTVYDLSDINEFTVEAGRPDTITKEKLEVIKKYNVDRISINPQTMNQKTLDLIGRKHSVEDIKECFYLARKLGFDNINMDIILGLPEENYNDVHLTLKELQELRPDSITVHTMAVKRASKLKELPLEEIMAQGRDVENMLKLTRQSALELGMKPYYMYRQKNMVGNFENVGYALPGKESIYNIEIIEEKENIIAVGAGAVTKLIHTGDKKIQRIENVKNFEHYIKRIDEMIERKHKFFKDSH
ncbi:coproporphyrinogen dehydrogenase HemZ [Vallitalea okinawensis]|uniref:coproporphyrinogen dehydrogenase HemZ n=1 Tax=Vallitalea okinawensis TaxID=2078660 RepID=UPI000CFAFB68|nr:coproporphyrinogen dehydrogenase HemZ [Vallitalea okinawensis]